MVCVKPGQMPVLHLCQYDKVGTHHYLTGTLTHFLCKPLKARVHFRRPAGNVNGPHLLFPADLHTRFHYFPPHDFPAVRPGLHMAVPAGQITEPSHIDLKHIQAFRVLKGWVNPAFKRLDFIHTVQPFD